VRLFQWDRSGTGPGTGGRSALGQRPYAPVPGLTVSNPPTAPGRSRPPPPPTEGVPGRDLFRVVAGQQPRHQRREGRPRGLPAPVCGRRRGTPPNPTVTTPERRFGCAPAILPACFFPLAPTFATVSYFRLTYLSRECPNHSSRILRTDFPLFSRLGSTTRSASTRSR